MGATAGDRSHQPRVVAIVEVDSGQLGVDSEWRSYNNCKTR